MFFLIVKMTYYIDWVSGSWQKPPMLSRALRPCNTTPCSSYDAYGKNKFRKALTISIHSGDSSMPRGREKDRDMRRKHRKNQRRVKGLEVARREKGKKK